LTTPGENIGVVISGDKTVAYDKVMAVMRELQQRGYARLGLLVKTES
jgi:biopolymer transport protein TolR